MPESLTQLRDELVVASSLYRTRRQTFGFSSRGRKDFLETSGNISDEIFCQSFVLVKDQRLTSTGSFSTPRSHDGVLQSRSSHHSLSLCSQRVASLPLVPCLRQSTTVERYPPLHLWVRFEYSKTKENWLVAGQIIFQRLVRFRSLSSELNADFRNLGNVELRDVRGRVHRRVVNIY